MLYTTGLDIKKGIKTAENENTL